MTERKVKAMKTTELTCIVCPMGCTLTVTQDEEGKILSVTGNTCPKGAEYAINECTNPLRTVTSTVRVSNRKDTMVSVKTAAPVPKGKMMEVMAMLRQISCGARPRISHRARIV